MTLPSFVVLPDPIAKMFGIACDRGADRRDDRRWCQSATMMLIGDANWRAAAGSTGASRR
jgi:hypothetical protein